MKDKEIQRKLAKLEALENGGVDNWDFYDDSLAEWRKENQVDKCIDEAIEGINDLLVEAKIEEPAGPHCGYAIQIDEAAISELLSKLLKDAQES